MIALVVAAGMNLFSYWNSDRMVLSMHGAQEVDARTAPDLYRLVQELASRAGLPMPRVYLIDNPQPNAFATGRNPEHAAVAVTTGLLNTLSREEVAGVIAHELAHIKNRDTLIMTITATIAGAISMLAQFGMFFGGNRDNNNGMGIIGTLAMVILAPIAAMLVQMAISRTREYAADRMGAQIAGEPSSSRRRSPAHRERRARRSRTSRPSAIPRPRTCSSSTRCRVQRMDNLFSTHPATENRIAALMQLAAQMGRGGYAPSGAAAPGARPAHGPWGGGSAAVRGAKIAQSETEPSGFGFVTMAKVIRRPFGASGRRSAGKRIIMTPAARRAAPAEVPGLTARRIAADILDNVLRRHRPLDARARRRRTHPGLAGARRPRPRAGAQAGRDRAAPPRHAAASARQIPRLGLSQGCAARRDRAADRRRADPVPRRAGPCGGRSQRAAGAGGPPRRAISRPDQRGAAPGRRAKGRTLLADARCRAARHAAMAVRALEQELRRRHRARDRDRARPRAAARSHREGRCRKLGAAPARPRAADRHACAPTTQGLVSLLPGYNEGAWWVQDAAAALPARLLGDVAGQARRRSLRRAGRQDRAARAGRRARHRGRPLGQSARARARQSRRGSACRPT